MILYINSYLGSDILGCQYFDILPATKHFIKNKNITTF